MVLRNIAFLVPLFLELALVLFLVLEEGVSFDLKVNFLFLNFNFPSSMYLFSNFHAMVKVSSKVLNLSTCKVEEMCLAQALVKSSINLGWGKEK